MESDQATARMRLALFAYVVAVAMAFGLVWGTRASAATIVTAFDSTYTAPNQWFVSLIANGGTATVQDLTGMGGNLENNQPLPVGAARLTTINTNPSRAEVAIANGMSGYGTAAALLPTFTASYQYWRDNLLGGNQAAAASFKLSFFNPFSVDPDQTLTLIYEPYINLGGNPPSGQWLNAAIGYNTGLFWSNGGLGASNSSGGPPFRTLSGWLSTLGTDFSNATLVAMSVGIGTFNPGVTTYFDDVQINVGTLNLAYDFNPQPLDNAVPESSTMTLSLILAGAGVGTAARRWPRSPVTQ